MKLTTLIAAGALMMLSSCSTPATSQEGSHYLLDSGAYDQGFKAGHSDAVYKLSRDPSRAIMDSKNNWVTSFTQGYVAGFDGAKKSH
jgi:hypothetical protein